MTKKKRYNQTDAPAETLAWGQENPLIHRTSKGWRQPGVDSDWDVDVKLMGERMTAARNSCGFSRNAVVRSLKIGYTSLLNWELGRREPTLYYAVILCKAYGVSLDWMILGKGPRLLNTKTVAQGDSFEIIDDGELPPEELA